MNNKKNSQVEANTSTNFLFSLLRPFSEHRLDVRKRIVFKPFNIITLLSLVPFFLGFSDFLNQNKNLKKILFEKNIPGCNVPTETLQWETFRYFNQTKKEFLLGLEKIHWSPNSLILTKTSFLEPFDQEVFLASFPKKDITEKKTNYEIVTTKKIFGNASVYLNSVDNKFIFLEKFNYSKPFITTQIFDQVLNSFYFDLDEIPVKLDNLNSYDSFPFRSLTNEERPEFKENLIYDSKTNWFTESSESSSLNQEQLLDKKNKIKQKKLDFQEKVWTQFKNNKVIFQKKNEIFSQKLHLNNLENSDIFKNQLTGILSLTSSDVTTSQVNRDLLFKKQTSWFLKKAQTRGKGYSLELFSTRNDGQNIKVIISDLDQLLMEQGFSFLRRMSGYKYPDMNLEQVNTFFIHRLFSEFPKNFIPQKSSSLNRSTRDLKVFFPANPSFIQNYSFENKKIPRFSIKTGLITLKDSENNETLYNEQAIFLNKKNGLDWELKNQNLRFWLKNYLSPLNPLPDSKQTILGNRIKTKIDFLFFKNQPMVAFFTPTEWEKISTKNKTRIEAFDINGVQIPAVEIFLKKTPYPTFKFDLNPTLDYLYSINSIATKIDLPVNTLEQALDLKSLSNHSYKKLLSIHTPFDNVLGLEKVFFDNWEPLTSRSWLIVSQIGFAFVCFNFLKSLITDYFNELIWFILEIGFSLGVIDENLKEEIELLTGQRDKGFRIISEPRKKFQDIAGIKILLPEIAEIVWFLRNRGKDFSLSKNFPRGLLLLGPPGTGKTVLVQALAGEAQVPVLTLSGSSLVAPGESGALKLEILFQEARQIAPCIVFIDEIETLAQKRQGVMQNPMGGDEIFSILEPRNTSFDNVHSTSGDFFKNSETSYFKNSESIASLTTKSTRGFSPLSDGGENNLPQSPSKYQQQEKYQQEQLTLLTELLIELDGVQTRQGVVVIGATNRPEMLDSAVLRPGRFDKIVELGLPSHEKRLEIFKLYGEIIGYDQTVSWEYFSKRTIGFTAADLASIMNQSSIRAIFNLPKNSPQKPKHTLQTIEHGIDRITTSELETPNQKVKTRFLERVAYYQAGKIILSKLLEYHPPILRSHLWPRRQNRRSLQILTNLQKYFFQFARRCEVEHRIIGAYGGKAAEILFLQKSPGKVSSFGLEDLSFAFVLACFTIEKWFLYSKSTVVAALTQLISNKNSYELNPEKIEFFKDVVFSMELPPHLFSVHENDIGNHPFSQNFFCSAWWQLQISQEFEVVQRHFADWYRLYIPNPEEKELNIDWSPPDEFYHRNRVIKYLQNNTSITWNDLHTIVRDYQVHSFIIQSFNKALCFLDENREYLDKLVFELIKREVLRESEIEQLTSLFNVVTTISISPSKTDNSSDIRILTNSFGQESRRKVKNWIDFADFLPTKE